MSKIYGKLIGDSKWCIEGNERIDEMWLEDSRYEGRELGLGLFKKYEGLFNNEYGEKCENIYFIYGIFDINSRELLDYYKVEYLVYDMRDVSEYLKGVGKLDYFKVYDYEIDEMIDYINSISVVGSVGSLRCSEGCRVYEY